MVIFESILWLLVLIGVMILVHELGHYWAARWFDVHVEVFSFGFGPRLFGVRRGETDFRFSAVLFGGYVKMAGEQPGDESISDPRAFLAKPRWQRLIIAAAGPAMNVLLAVVLLTGLFMVEYPKAPPSTQEGTIGYVAPKSPAFKAGIQAGDKIAVLDRLRNPNWEDIILKELASPGQTLQVKIERGKQEFWTSVTPELDQRTGLGVAGWQDQKEVMVASVSPDMPAAAAGLEKGDILLTANGMPLRSLFRLQEIIKATNGKRVELGIQRDGRPRQVAVDPVFAAADGGPKRWMIGVTLGPRVEMVQLPFVDALRESVRHNIKSAGLIYRFLERIVTQQMPAKSLQGPIGIAELSRTAAREGAMTFLELMAMVSLNLAVFNLLPIPILDGGVILMLLVEMVMRRDLSMRVKEAVFKLGFVFLMAVMAFVIYNDISKILPG